MKLNGTPDGSTRDSDEEAEVLEDDLVILDDDQAEQFLQQLQQGNGAAPEEEEEEAEEADEEMECEADGAVGDVPDDALTVFRSHTNSVFCVAVDPNDKLAASGGEDDVAYIYDLETGNVAHKCEGHKDSVTAVAFNHNGSLLATADLSGLILVWEAVPESSPSAWKSVWRCEEASELQWLSWHTNNNCLLAGSGDDAGCVWLWLVPTDKSKCLVGGGGSCVAGSLLSDGKRLVSLHEPALMVVWSLRDAAALHSVPLGVGNSRRSEEELDLTPVCLACRRGEGAFQEMVAAGNACGRIFFVHAAHGQIIHTFYVGRDESVETIAFSSSHTFVAFGTIGGLLGIFDLSSMTKRHIIELEKGITRLVCAPSEPYIFTASLGGTLTMWDYRNAKEIRTWSGHRDHVMDLTLFAKEKRILSCGDSKDKSVRIFAIE